MDYEKIYNDAYLMAHIEVEKYIKDFLTAEENSIYFFNENYNTIRKIHESEYHKDKFNKIEPYIEIYVEFERNRQKIRNDSINKAFKLKVFPLFEKKKDQIPYNFEKLIQEIATFNAKNKAFQILSNNNRLFDLIYQSDDYSKFEIKEYKQAIEDTELFIYYDKIVHPDRYQISTKDKKNRNKNLEKSISNFEFEIDEQALILNLCLLDKKSIPLTEKVRLLILIGKISDNSVLVDSSSDNDFYQKVNKGILKKGSTLNKIIMLNNILLKLEGQKLEITIQTIKKHKLTLQNEQNNTKKE